MDLERLKEPFADVKTRPGPGGTQLSYITSRQLQDRLDEVVGPENWRNEFRRVGEELVCRIGIRFGNQDWIWKEDVGTESNIEAEKGIYSDAFKRAGVQWGVARYLYGDTPQPTKTFPQQTPGANYATNKQIGFLDSLLEEEDKLSPGTGNRTWDKLGKEPTKEAVGAAIDGFVKRKKAREEANA